MASILRFLCIIKICLAGCIICSIFSSSASAGKLGECLVMEHPDHPEGSIAYNGEQVSLPHWTEDCSLVEVKTGVISVLFRDSYGQVSSIKASVEDPVKNIVQAHNDPGFLRRAFNIISGKVGEKSLYGGERLSAKSIFPALPYDDVYIGASGLIIPTQQYYLDAVSGSDKLKRTDFTIRALDLENLDTGKSQQFSAGANGNIHIPASAFEADTEYAWTVSVESQPVKGRFFTVDEETKTEIDQGLARLNAIAGLKDDKDTHDILSAGLLDDMGCKFQSSNLLKSKQKGRKQ